MSKVSEKRAILRRDFSQPVNFKFSRERDGQVELFEETGRGVDICSHGLGLITDQKFNKGDVFKVTLPSTAEETLLPVYSQVVWVMRQEDGYRVGLHFLG